LGTELLIMAWTGSFNVVFHPVTIEVVIEILAIMFLLACSAMMSGGEVAFFSLKPADIKALEENKTKKAKKVLSLLNSPEKLLANILIANNFINITIVILSTYVTAKLVDFSQMPLLGLLFQVVVVTFVILLIGEVMPKVFATDHRLGFALSMAYPLIFISKAQAPLAAILVYSSTFVQKRLAHKRQNISINDLSDALEITSGSIKEDKSILEGIVKFGNIDVSEIMRPRIDIFAVEINTTYTKLLSTIVETGYSRIPVFSENLDNIKGILFTKDLLPYIHESNKFNWQALIRQAFFVPESKKIDDLLSDFQKNKTHFAVVIDEYGGTCGIITMEDILEEIVGEIADESDVDEELLYKKLANNVYLFEAKILLNDFHKITSIDSGLFEDIGGEFETLAGLILELKGEIPRKNDKIEFKNLQFIIESVDSRRIKQIKLFIK
jgi:putative hemolysin